MEVKDFDTTNLLKEILTIRDLLSKLYNQKGPNSSDYITLSIKHNSLINQYFDEKRFTLIND